MPIPEDWVRNEMGVVCLPITPIFIAILLSQNELPLVAAVVSLLAFYAGRGIVRTSIFLGCEKYQSKITYLVPCIVESAMVFSGYVDLGGQLSNGMIVGLYLSQSNFDLSKFGHAASGVLLGFFLVMSKQEDFGPLIMRCVFCLVCMFHVPPESDGKEHQRVLGMPFSIATLVGFGPAVRTADWRAAAVVAVFTMVAIAASFGVQREVQYSQVVCASKWFIITLQLVWLAIGLLDFDDRELWQLVPSFVLFYLSHLRYAWAISNKPVTPVAESIYVGVIAACLAVYLVGLLTHAALIPAMMLSV